MLIAVLMLTGCASTTNAPEEPRIPQASLIAECPDLPEASDGKLSTILTVSLERSQLYYDCQARHKALSEWAVSPVKEKAKK
ncbi:hypothetical protein ABD07_03950 [Nitrosomonas oligotropha]|nr:hypothetical protein [Nitrosomonas oligotropha]